MVQEEQYNLLLVHKRTTQSCAYRCRVGQLMATSMLALSVVSICRQLRTSILLILVQKLHSNLHQLVQILFNQKQLRLLRTELILQTTHMALSSLMMVHSRTQHLIKVQLLLVLQQELDLQEQRIKVMLELILQLSFQSLEQQIRSVFPILVVIILSLFHKTLEQTLLCNLIR